MLRGLVIPLLTVLLVVAISVTLFLYRDRVAEFKELGYLGAFLISLVANATIILPMPGILIISALGAALNPVVVGIIGGAGGALGEMVGYVAGYSGRSVIQDNRTYTRARYWMRKWGIVAIFVFALVPFLPLDVAGMTAGVLRFSIWRFLLACWAGKALLYSGVALAGFWGLELLMRLLKLAAPLSGAGVAALAVLALLVLALFIEDWTWKRGR